MEFLADRPSWFLLGPCLGLLVVGLLATLNVRMGVLGGWSDVLDRAQGRAGNVSWKGWFFLGVIVGGLVFHVLAGQATTGRVTATAGSRASSHRRWWSGRCSSAPAC